MSPDRPAMDRPFSSPFVHGLLLAGVLAGGGCNRLAPPSGAPLSAMPPSREPALLQPGPAAPIRPPMSRRQILAEWKREVSEAQPVGATAPVERPPATRPPEADPIQYGPNADPPIPGAKSGEKPMLRRMPAIAEMASNAPIGPVAAKPAPPPPAPAIAWPAALPTESPQPEENQSAPQVASLPPPSAAPAPKPSEPPAPQPPAAIPVRRDLLPAPLAPQEAESLRSVDLQAQQKLVRAQELAGRGAAWSARGELLDVLRMIAEACDSMRQSEEFRRSLRNGLEALREVEDFAPKQGNAGREINVPVIVAAHRTPALKGAPVDHLTPLAAQQEYLSYAQRQLAAAAGGTVSGSAALYGLGRLQETVSTTSAGGRSPIAAPRAMALYQAALLADRTNHLAANELGVLLAKYGENAAAKQILIHSLQTQQQAVTWNNLAIVHDRLGERDLAQKARLAGQQIATKTGSTAGAAERVRWVDAATFAAASDEGGWPEQTAPAAKPATTSTAKVPAPSPPAETKTATKSNDTGWSFPFWTARGGTTESK